MSSPKSRVVPVFIPHTGCTHRCVFCNQNTITGSDRPPAPDEVAAFLEGALGDAPDAVIAFYGGSFTGIPRDEQDAYLGVAGRFVRAGRASGIRLSTRPDLLDGESASLLASRGVATVELGAQSMDDTVLKASGRGHTAADTVAAARAVRAAGVELGVQVMAGLPGDTAEGFLETARRAVALGPSFVRVYPVVVVDGSPLALLWRRGGYVPLGLDEAVGMCADAAELFEAAGIRVERMGLQASGPLERSILAGPYHPAFGHMVRSRIALGRMQAAIGAARGAGRAELLVSPRELSVYLGLGRGNVERLRSDAGLDVTIKADPGLPPGSLSVKLA